MNRMRLLAFVGVSMAVLVLVGSLLSGMGAGDAGVLPVRRGPVDAADEERIRVEVLNAAGITGLARGATDRLRSAGYDVVYYGNAESFGRDTSVVLDRIGRPEAARSVARSIGIPVVRERRDSSLYLDVTVIIGADWTGIPAPPDSARLPPPL